MAFFQKNLSYNSIITILDDNYPLKLKQLYHLPLVLFYQGELTLLKRPFLAIVGTRQCSYYSEEILHQILPAIVRHQIVTISGLAQGIDSLCHRLTITGQRDTIGVIGNGLDVFLPLIKNYK